MQYACDDEYECSRRSRSRWPTGEMVDETGLVVAEGGAQARLSCWDEAVARYLHCDKANFFIGISECIYEGLGCLRIPEFI